MKSRLLSGLLLLRLATAAATQTPGPITIGTAWSRATATQRNPGDTFPLTLTFVHASAVSTMMAVEKAGASHM